MLKNDFLVIGSGIAGLSFALKVADQGKVLIVTKADEEESNTKYAQGGIAAVMYAPDSFEKHIKDTLVAGDGLCDEKVVRMVISESPERIRELIDWGAEFDRNPDGNFNLGREGGHSEKRILHSKDRTGLEIERALLSRIHAHKNIEITDHFFALEIITQHHLGVYVNSKTKPVFCYGAYALNQKTGQVEKILSRVTVMATGGAGHVYASTTNPVIATGDGVAMVYRAKGKIEGMEFFQFHPTALYNPGEKPAFLISEAVRGAGAVLRTRDGEEFMHKYDPRGSLASRDIVARSIDHEMKMRGDDFVCLDATHLEKGKFRDSFPGIFSRCEALGINPETDFIPVVPAAHYSCGGIAVGINAESSIENLYAVGECASTGLHGANRLASNSLLEAVVFAHRAAMDAIKKFKEIKFQTDIPDWNAEGTIKHEEMVLITESLREVQAIMSHYVGIVRSDLRLKRALDRLLILHRETEELYQRTRVIPELCELRNLIKVSYIIIKQALARRNSVGLHYNLDCPTLEKLSAKH